MFKLYIKNSNATTNSICMVSSINLWHASWCSLLLILMLNKDLKKCEIHSKAKITKRSHGSVK
jgi:hypothetical protein